MGIQVQVICTITDKNKAQVNEIENKLPGLIEIINSKPKNDTKKLETKIIYWKLYSLLS